MRKTKIILVLKAMGSVVKFNYYIIFLHLSIAFLLPVHLVAAEDPTTIYTRQDSLRGSLNPFRTCYDVYYYDLRVMPDIAAKSLEGSCEIFFTLLEESDSMQIDLFESWKIDNIKFSTEKGQAHYRREGNAIFVATPASIKSKKRHSLKIVYSGKPAEAENPPWDGGFVWDKDQEGKPWIGVACQGFGASSWWPNKDHLSDKPDSMRISITVAGDLMGISNGKLESVRRLRANRKEYRWFVSYPINNYNVSINIANYAHFSEIHRGEHATTELDFYVLQENLPKAKSHFRQVLPMLDCFEQYFGAYPFSRDGYKLVETPYLGMEHQSAVAYGNGYRNGTLGMSPSEPGTWFDYIIIHESAHEWWGNTVSCADLSDMWIHEAFTTYAEALYVECLYGYDRAMEYLGPYKKLVLYDRPMQGDPGVNKAGSRDMYYKGALMLNTLRHIVDNDSLWFGMFGYMLKEFAFKPTNYDDFVEAISDFLKIDLEAFFSQYVQHIYIPQLVVEIIVSSDEVMLHYYWQSDVEEFEMPVWVDFGTGEFEKITPDTSSKVDIRPRFDPGKFRVAIDRFFIDLDVNIRYMAED
ncbi:MAG: M1 family metallopeptidase [Cyclobacteriaceae bacterium]|nr:M1 family metallopeptidase [Cyclobacteriaceae bacterium]